MNGVVWWMTDAQLRDYAALGERLTVLNDDHRDLIRKAVARTISAAEATRLRAVNKEINDIFAARKVLEDANPLLPENILRVLGGGNPL